MEKRIQWKLWALLNQILVALGGTPDNPDYVAPDHPLQPGDLRGGGDGSSTVPGSFGHSGHSPYHAGQELGRGFRDVILSTNPRGGLMSMPA